MKMEYRRRKADGLIAVWRFEPSEDRASPWVCIAVCGNAGDAVAIMKREREAA